MIDKILKFAGKVEKNFLLRVIRRGMTIMIPIILVSSIALAIIAFPITAFRDWIENVFGGALYNILAYTRDFSFSYFSVILAVTTSISFLLEKKEKVERMIFAPVASCISFLIISRVNSAEAITKMGVSGCFFAFLIAIGVTALYVKLIHTRLATVWENTDGNDVIYAEAMKAILPLAIIMLLSAAVSYLISDIFGIDNIVTWLQYKFERIVSVFRSELSIALMCSTLIHALWFFGIHGSNVLESVMRAHEAVGEGIIFSKTFFDTFVIVGGCGMGISLVLAILIGAKQKRTRRLAKAALLPVMLNINEIVTFGLPIIWNPIMLIPFVLVPIECTLIAYTAIRLGLVAPIVTSVEWTTPIFISGYLSTGKSVSGIILQLVNLSVGTLTYIPFMKMNEMVYAAKLREQINELTEEIRRAKITNTDAKLLERTDALGSVANTLMNDLKEAIKRKQIYLLYQPQFMADGTCVGAESLIRWHHPVAGFLYPPLIIYLAQEGDCLKELDRQIIDMACLAVSKVEKRSQRKFKISINMTARTLLWEGLETYMSSALAKYDVRPERIAIEIQEHDLLSYSDLILDKINTLSSKGHPIFIDDCEMSRMSIMYMKDNKFDGVKLNGSLIRNLPESRTNREIVISVIEMCEKLGMHVVAKYVETKDHLDILKSIKCDMYQGFYFSRPVALEEFIRRLENKK